MRIGHVIPSIDIQTGGPARSSTHLIKSLIKCERSLRVDLFTFVSENPIINEFQNSRLSLNFCNKNKLGFSNDLKRYLMNDSCDILHGHSIWGLSIHQMAVLARKLNKPYIISTRGMLEPWSLTQSFFKKKLAMHLYQDKDIKYASCIHATAQSEAENIRALGYYNPIAVIPNGINLDEYPHYSKEIKTKKKALFLSRIHVKKGIENLIDAWTLLDNKITKNWHVEIIGNGELDYIISLRNKIKKVGLETSIKVLDPVFGDDKIKAYQSADLFVLPTYSENFGIVIAEALASSLPVITTKGAPWKELNTNNCGDWIEIGLQPLKESLSKMLTKSEMELAQMGRNGRKLIEQNYSIDSVATSMYELYQWICNNKSKPNFVDIYKKL